MDIFPAKWCVKRYFQHEKYFLSKYSRTSIYWGNNWVYPPLKIKNTVNRGFSIGTKKKSQNGLKCQKDNEGHVLAEYQRRYRPEIRGKLGFVGYETD